MCDCRHPLERHYWNNEIQSWLCTAFTEIMTPCSCREDQTACRRCSKKYLDVYCDECQEMVTAEENYAKHVT
jgi:hypothetical protein